VKNQFQSGLVLGLLFLFPSLDFASGASIVPAVFSGDTVPATQHPMAAQINLFIRNQAAYAGTFTPTGLSRAGYLPVIESIARAMLKYQNAKGQIVDPVKGREYQYSTPCFAHAVSVLCGSGFARDSAFLQAGINAMDAAILHMVNDDVPDGHGDFFTVPIMFAFWNFKNVVAASKLSTWRTDIGKINPSAVYGNSAPNWIGINMTGEFMRYIEGLTTINYVQDRISFQITRMGKEGMYQDASSPETTTVTNSDGNSVAYDNVARAFLGLVACKGYTGGNYQELRLRLCRGAWTGLLYQSPFGEVPTGMRSSHHFWNEAEAALNYEIWAAQYAKAGRLQTAGAFKRAAMISLTCVKSWLRPDGSGYVTKARFPIDSQWGYMAYSSHTQYNLWCASALALAWEFSDTTIREKPTAGEIGGFVCQNIPGFKKIYANAGGSYIEYDVRGDDSHNPTGLLRLHLKTSYPQLGPSDGAVGVPNPNAQYKPLYPFADPANLLNLSVGPAWQQSGTWYPLAETKQLPQQILVLRETPELSAFRVVYALPAEGTLYESITVEPRGVTVVDSLVGGTHTAIRAYYPMLRSDGEEQSQISVSGNQVTVRLKNKGIRFMIRRPDTAKLIRTNVLRNHRNGKCEAIYAEVQGRVVESYVSAWPEYDPTAMRASRSEQPGSFPVRNLPFTMADIRLPQGVAGSYTLVVYSLQGREVARISGIVSAGRIASLPFERDFGAGIYRGVLIAGKVRVEGMLVKVE
jgi:hypothetical protein